MRHDLHDIPKLTDHHSYQQDFDLHLIYLSAKSPFYRSQPPSFPHEVVKKKLPDLVSVGDSGGVRFMPGDR